MDSDKKELNVNYTLPFVVDESEEVEKQVRDTLLGMSEETDFYVFLPGERQPEKFKVRGRFSGDMLIVEFDNKEDAERVALLNKYGAIYELEISFQSEEDDE